MAVAKVSIIIPAYNSEKTVLETIRSILQQTFMDFEVIVINDGSTDDTLNLVKQVKDKRIKIFSFENSGVATARNRGIEKSTGRYIAFIDADDLWTPKKLESQFLLLELHPEAGVAYSWTSLIDEQGAFLCNLEQDKIEGYVYESMLVNNFLHSGSNPLIRKSIVDEIGGFDPSLEPSEDWDFYIRLSAKTYFLLVAEAQVLYRQTSTSASAKIGVMRQQAEKTIEKSFSIAPDHLKRLRNESLAYLYQHCSRQYLNKSGHSISGLKVASEMMLRALILRPQSLVDKDKYSLRLLKRLTKGLFFALCRVFIDIQV